MRAIIFFLALALAAREARADETTRMLAQSGAWGAMAHSPSELARPDVCMAMNVSAKFMLRMDTTTFEIRLSDPSWSLPANALGTIKVQIGSYNHTFDSESLNSTVVTADVGSLFIVPLLDALGAGDVALVTVGKEQPRRVSLNGSAPVLNALRTCGGIPGTTKGGGSNPFE